MDELISKMAVIEAIEKARANVGHNLERSIGKSIIEILDDVGRDVNRLPSAEPQIIRCKDCKYAEYIDDVQSLWCTECGNGRTVAPYDFCSYGEVRAV